MHLWCALYLGIPLVQRWNLLYQSNAVTIEAGVDVLMALKCAVTVQLSHMASPRSLWGIQALQHCAFCTNAYGFWACESVQLYTPH